MANLNICQIVYSSYWVVTLALLCILLHLVSTISDLKEGAQLEMSARIAGGDITAPNEFPWMAYVKLRQPFGAVLCGGTVISERCVLTYDHCVDDVNGNPYVEITLGAHNISDTNEPGRLVLTSNEYYVNNEVNDNSTGNRPVIIVLPYSLKFSEYIQPITLKYSDPVTNSRINDTVLLTGWGSLSGFNPTPSQLLRKTNVRIISNEECKKEWLNGVVMENNMCTSGQGGKGICRGDGGGPMSYYDETDGTWYLMGVAVEVNSVDQTYQCQSGIPSVFIRLQAEIIQDWVESLCNVRTTEHSTTSTTQSTTQDSTTDQVTGSTRTVPPPQFECPPDNSGNGLYPNPDDCRSFYECSNGVAYLYDCPDDLVFNPQTNQCDYLFNVPECI